MTARSHSAAALVVAAAALLFTCVFGFLSFTPGVDPEVGAFLELAFYGSAITAMGAVAAYFVLSRRSGAEGVAFERLLDQRKAALGAVGIGMLGVLVGVGWYFSRMVGDGGAWADAPGAEAVATIDTAGIAAFLGVGALFVLGAAFMAIRSERAAIRLAREEAGVSR